MKQRRAGWFILGSAGLLGLGAASLAGCTGKSDDGGAAPPAGCVKDTDCKGDRLCVAGQCQDAPATSSPAPTRSTVPAPPPPAPTPPPTSAFREVPEAEWKPALGPRLRRGAVVAHAVFEGPLGPSATTMFVVTREADQFHATVWVGGRGYRNSPLANNGGVATKIPAVSFFDADGDGKRDVLVMATYAPKGGGAAAYENVLLRWNGTALVRMHNLESTITGLDSVAAVRAALKR